MLFSFEDHKSSNSDWYTLLRGAQHATLSGMTNSIRQKGRKQIFDSSSKKSIQAGHENRLRLMPAALDPSTAIDDIDVPGYQLHPLKGKLKGRWFVSVSGNWRLTFELTDGNVQLLDYEDNHR